MPDRHPRFNLGLIANTQARLCFLDACHQEEILGKICAKTTKTGKRCKAYAQAGSDFCFTHDPKSAPARRIARKLGGYNSRQTPRSPFPKCDVSTAKGLIAFVDALIHETWSLGNSVGRVRALSQLTQLQNELVNLRDAEKRKEKEDREFEEDWQDREDHLRWLKQISSTKLPENAMTGDSLK